jgi:hypothetical protein
MTNPSGRHTVGVVTTAERGVGTVGDHGDGAIPSAPPVGWTGTRAPRKGAVVLPDHIDPTNPRRVYELDEPVECKYVYEVVLVDGTAADVERFVDRARLVELWPCLYLPRWVRDAWAPTIAAELSRR